MTAVDPTGLKADLVAATTVSPIVYVLVTNQYATLKELRDDYGIWEILSLYECCLVSLKNRYELSKGGKT